MSGLNGPRGSGACREQKTRQEKEKECTYTVSRCGRDPPRGDGPACDEDAGTSVRVTLRNLWRRGSFP